ncbi:MAG: hypothetical protein Q9217_003385 [Psora testacea]
MTPLKDLLRKKDNIKINAPDPAASLPDPTPEFTFLRSDSNTQELIKPPTFSGDGLPSSHADHFSKHFSRLRSSSNASQSSRTSTKGERRLSQRLHLRSHSRASSQSSTNVPKDLPDIQDVAVHAEDEQAQWEERATILAKENPNNRPTSQGHSRPRTLRKAEVQHPAHLGDRPTRGRSISDAKSDDDIQEAIRLHEAGKLIESTAMFGRLADSNAMAQILYGLALRHGWGIEPNPSLAVTYLSQAASSSASVESDALHRGVKKGGAAKGELVLAIYELANSFRHGWGVEQDPVAARKCAYDCRIVLLEQGVLYVPESQIVRLVRPTTRSCNRGL